MFHEHTVHTYGTSKLQFPLTQHAADDAIRQSPRHNSSSSFSFAPASFNEMRPGLRSAQTSPVVLLVRDALSVVQGRSGLARVVPYSVLARSLAIPLGPNFSYKEDGDILRLKSETRDVRIMVQASRNLRHPQHPQASPSSLN